MPYDGNQTEASRKRPYGDYTGRNNSNNNNNSVNHHPVDYYNTMNMSFYGDNILHHPNLYPQPTPYNDGRQFFPQDGNQRKSHKYNDTNLDNLKTLLHIATNKIVAGVENKRPIAQDHEIEEKHKEKKPKTAEARHYRWLSENKNDKFIVEDEGSLRFQLRNDYNHTMNRNVPIENDVIEIGSRNFYNNGTDGNNNSFYANPYSLRGDSVPMGTPPPPLGRTHTVRPIEPQPPAGKHIGPARPRHRYAQKNPTSEKCESGKEKSLTEKQNLGLFRRRIKHAQRRACKLLEEAAVGKGDIKALSYLMKDQVYHSVKDLLGVAPDWAKSENVFAEKLSTAVSDSMKDVQKYAEDIKSLPDLLQKEFSAAEYEINTAFERMSAPEEFKEFILTEMKLEATTMINAEIGKNADFHVEALVKKIMAEKLAKYLKLIAFYK